MRKKYKSLYLMEKMQKETIEHIFNNLIEQLKTFDLKVEDEIEKDKYSPFDIREIYIEQDKEHYIEIAIRKMFKEEDE